VDFEACDENRIGIFAFGGVVVLRTIRIKNIGVIYQFSEYEED
jgi:hypothetical protein